MQVLLKKLQQRRERLKRKYPNNLKQGKLLARRTRKIIKLKFAPRRKKKICQAIWILNSTDVHQV